MRVSSTARPPKGLPALDDAIKKRVAQATVRLLGTEGQGVLVPGGFILTAAHCINWDGEGRMALGDHFVERIKTSDGQTLLVAPYAVEPMADIAVLSSVDNQAIPDDATAFEEFCERTPAIPIRTADIRVERPVRVHVLSHKRKWIHAKVTRYGFPGSLPAGSICLDAFARIEGGTSGGPVVDRRGRLVGVISNSSEEAYDGAFNGHIPVAHLALPRWVMNQIEAVRS